MKKTISVYRTEKIKTDIEVEFPIYRKHDLLLDDADVVYYQRTDHDGWEVSIKKSYDYLGKNLSFELERSEGNTLNGATDLDYALGRGDHASSAEEFHTVLAEAIEFAKIFAAK